MIILFGAAGTLGRAVIKQLSDENITYGLAVNSRIKEVEKFSLSLTNKPRFIVKCDVTNIRDIKKVFKLSGKDSEEISGIINNFAYTYLDEKMQGSVDDLEKIKKIFKINYLGVANIFDVSFNYRKNKNKKDFCIVNVLSNSIKTLNASNVHYISSKSAIETLSKYHALHNAKLFRVNCVSPGFMESSLTKRRFIKDRKEIIRKTPIGKLVNPTDVAKTITNIIISLKTINGETIYIDGGRTLF